MCHLLETIKVENGQFCHPEYHLKRMQRSSSELFGIDIRNDVLNGIVIPGTCKSGVFRCRIMYRTMPEKIEFTSYNPRLTSSLKIVDGSNIDYSHKFADRQHLDKLFEQRDGCDDVLIIKNGRVTDTSVANVLFFDGNTWYTPEEPLLHGTMRQFLIDNGMIRTKRIAISDLFSFQSVMLINALRPFDISAAFPVSMVKG